MSRRVSPSTDQVYGLQRVTRIWGVSRATVYRHRHPSEAIERRRPGPLGAMADERPGAGDPAAPAGQPVPRRGLPQAVGATAPAGIRTSRRAPDGTITTKRVDLM